MPTPARVRRWLRARNDRRVASRARWVDGDSVSTRSYPDYESYLLHQSTKLDAREEDVRRYDKQLRVALSERLRPDRWDGKRVLCLAARLGGEVAAFREAGAFAFGIDLNPGPSNPYVVTGDFHALAFPDASVDVVYTNSLDHAFDLQRIATEVRRVLTTDGVFIVEAMDFESQPPGAWETTVWTSLEELKSALQNCGFRVESESPISAPWRGWHLQLRPGA